MVEFVQLNWNYGSLNTYTYCSILCYCSITWIAVCYRILNSRITSVETLCLWVSCLNSEICKICTRAGRRIVSLFTWFLPFFSLLVIGWSCELLCMGLLQDLFHMFRNGILNGDPIQIYLPLFCMEDYDSPFWRTMSCQPCGIGHQRSFLIFFYVRHKIFGRNKEEKSVFPLRLFIELEFLSKSTRDYRMWWALNRVWRLECAGVHEQEKDVNNEFPDSNDFWKFVFLSNLLKCFCIVDTKL